MVKNRFPNRLLPLFWRSRHVGTGSEPRSPWPLSFARLLSAAAAHPLFDPPIVMRDLRMRLIPAVLPAVRGSVRVPWPLHLQVL